MVSRLFWRKIRRDLWARKGALAALLAIMAIGVGVYIGMAAVYLDLDRACQDYYSAYRLADFAVYCKRAPRWVVDQIQAMPHVREARGRIQQAVLIDWPGICQPIAGIAFSLPLERQPILNNVLLRTGTWFSGQDRDEVIVDHAFAQANGLEPGARIQVQLLDKQHDLLVVGTAMAPEFVYLIPPGGGFAPDPEHYGVLYLPESFLAESSDLDGAINQILGTVDTPSETVLDFLLREMEDDLDRYGVSQAVAYRDQVSVRFLADELQGLKVSAQITPTIFLMVAALVLHILVGRLVKQQRGIIGTLKALGYSTRQVFVHYLGYGVLIGLLGAGVGVLFGMWLQGFYVQLYRTFFALPQIDPHLYPMVILKGAGLAVLFSVLGTIKAVRDAASMQPAESMRPAAPEKWGKILPERLPALWRRLPFAWKMILRTVFRNPFRSAVSVFAAAISTALIVMSLCNMDGLNSLMNHEFNRVAHQDYTIALRDPVGRGLQSELRHFPSHAVADTQLSVVCDLKNGLYSKRTGVIGLLPGDVLCTPLDLQGRPLAIPETGIVLTKKLAELLHVSVGESIRIQPLIARREQGTAPVVGIADSYFGLAAYAHLPYLSRLLGEEWVANSVYFMALDKEGGDGLMRDWKRRPAVVGVSRRLEVFELLQKTFGDTMNGMIAVMVLFSGMIAFGSVLNAALVSLSERQRDVGTLRVLGYTPRQVARIFSGESYLLNVLGMILGIYLGMVLLHGLAMAYNTELYRFPVVVRLRQLILAVSLMMGFVWLAQRLVLRLIKKLPWLDVLQVKE